MFPDAGPRNGPEMGALPELKAFLISTRRLYVWLPVPSPRGALGGPSFPRVLKVVAGACPGVTSEASSGRPGGPGGWPAPLGGLGVEAYPCKKNAPGAPGSTHAQQSVEQLSAISLFLPLVRRVPPAPSAQALNSGWRRGRHGVQRGRTPRSQDSSARYIKPPCRDDRIRHWSVQYGPR